MSSVNNGDQTVLWKYETPLTGIDLAKIIKGLTVPGILSGGELTFSSPDTVYVAPVELFVTPNNQSDTLLKVISSESATILSDLGNPYVVFRFEWRDQRSWYGDFITVSSVEDDDIFLGQLNWDDEDDPTTIVSVDYTRADTEIYPEKQGLIARPTYTSVAEVSVKGGTFEAVTDQSEIKKVTIEDTILTIPDSGGVSSYNVIVRVDSDGVASAEITSGEVYDSSYYNVAILTIQGEDYPSILKWSEISNFTPVKQIFEKVSPPTSPVSFALNRWENYSQYGIYFYPIHAAYHPPSDRIFCIADDTSVTNFSYGFSDNGLNFNEKYRDTDIGQRRAVAWDSYRSQMIAVDNGELGRMSLARSTSDAKTWSFSNPLFDMDPYCVAVDSDSGIITAGGPGLNADVQNVGFSEDGGDTWTISDLSLNVKATVHSSEKQIYVAVGIKTTGESIYYSEDGTTWIAATAGLVDLSVAIYIPELAKFFASGNSAVYSSEDGKTWVDVTDVYFTGNALEIEYNSDFAAIVVLMDSSTDQIIFSYDGESWMNVTVFDSSVGSQAYLTMVYSPKIARVYTYASHYVGGSM